MSEVEKSKKWPVTIAAIQIIEEEAGEPIEKISVRKLLTIVNHLYTGDFYSKGLNL